MVLDFACKAQCLQAFVISYLKWQLDIRTEGCSIHSAMEILTKVIL